MDLLRGNVRLWKPEISDIIGYNVWDVLHWNSRTNMEEYITWRESILQLI